MLESGRPTLRTPTPSHAAYSSSSPPRATSAVSEVFVNVPRSPESVSSVDIAAHHGRLPPNRPTSSGTSTPISASLGSGHSRSHSHNHPALLLSVNANSQLNHAPPLKSKPPLLRSLSDTSHAAATVSQLPSEQIVTYRSYARHTNNADHPYMSYIRGWLFHPHYNRKGKLMIAALEKVVGSPGKYSSIAEAAAQVSESEINKDNPDSDGVNQSFPTTPVNGKVSTPGTPTGTPTGFSGSSLAETKTNGGSQSSRDRTLTRESSSDSIGRGSLHRLGSAASNGLQTLTSHTMGALHHRLNSPSTASFNLGTPRSQSPAPSAGNSSPEISRTSSWISFRPSMLRTRSSKSSVDLQDLSPPSLSVTDSEMNTAPNSPQIASQPFDGASTPHGETSSPTSLPGTSKRPQPRRTGTPSSESKQPSTSHLTKKGQKLTMRERMAAIAHKSLPYRDVKIVIESAPDSQGHTLRRSFWATTDESGRFSNDCGTPFRPAKVRAFHGAANHESKLLLMPRTGLSIISDIDDTVRHTGVTKSKREVLHNVLARSFDDCCLDGVADWYKRMADAGANFHYVSNSPWQLYDVVNGFLGHHSFPEGSMHLKKYSGVFDGLEAVKERKKKSLEKILRDFPGHKFILIGDSGEADLEAYTALAKEFPKQVIAIYIRDISLTNEESLQVYQRHFDKYRPTNWCPLESKAPPKLPPRTRTVNEELLTRPSTAPSRPSIDDSADGSSTLTRDSVLENSNETRLSAETQSVADSASTVETQPPNASSEQPPPAKLLRPRLLRRTSSKIIDHISSATRFLGPQLTSRPQTGPSTDNSSRPSTTTHPRNSKTFDAGRTGAPNSSSESIFRLPHLASRARTVLGGGGDPQSYENDIDNVFVPSTQDIIDYERNSDKRSDSWKQRVFAQHAELPRNVELKMYRAPSDIEDSSIELIESVLDK